jgi:hypothetical protein
MKIYYKIFALFFLVLQTTIQINAQDATKAHKDSLNSIITTYYDLNFKIFQATSTVEDINNVFEIFTDDFTYIHPKYGGTYTRKDLYI